MTSIKIYDVFAWIMLPVWGYTCHAIQLIPDATAGEETCLQQIRNYCTVCAEVLEPILLLCSSVSRNRIVMKALLKVIKG